jgi:hypothetical protein
MKLLGKGKSHWGMCYPWMTTEVAIQCSHLQGLLVKYQSTFTNSIHLGQPCFMIRMENFFPAQSFSMFKVPLQYRASDNKEVKKPQLCWWLLLL